MNVGGAMTWAGAVFWILLGVLVYGVARGAQQVARVRAETNRRLNELGARMERAEALLQQVVTEKEREQCDD